MKKMRMYLILFFFHLFSLSYQRAPHPPLFPSAMVSSACPGGGTPPVSTHSFPFGALDGCLVPETSLPDEEEILFPRILPSAILSLRRLRSFSTLFTTFLTFHSRTPRSFTSAIL
uniref:Putative secreted protein n=1 Tax=Lutzomyia longipalpis TaxID=7200 RepID=A0A7G3ANH4_LUTLO